MLMESLVNELKHLPKDTGLIVFLHPTQKTGIAIVGNETYEFEKANCEKVLLS